MTLPHLTNREARTNSIQSWHSRAAASNSLQHTLTKNVGIFEASSNVLGAVGPHCDTVRTGGAHLRPMCARALRFGPLSAHSIEHRSSETAGDQRDPPTLARYATRRRAATGLEWWNVRVESGGPSPNSRSRISGSRQSIQTGHIKADRLKDPSLTPLSQRDRPRIYTKSPPHTVQLSILSHSTLQ